MEAILPGSISALDYVRKVAKPISIEKTWAGGFMNYASNSEIRRLFQKRCIRINNEFPTWDDKVQFPVSDLVLFPNNKNKRVRLA
uniref:Uncharacterized protein n=1 Tax=viral metagenome TaxID=1070528 RepID=A0A6M3JYC1_9ZZZZ